MGTNLVPDVAPTRLAQPGPVTRAGIVVCGSSVDVSNPKVVRSCAGAIFGVVTVEADDAMATLEHLGRAGRHRLATRAQGGVSHDEVDFSRSSAVVLGNEAHGLPDALDAVIDGWVTIDLQAPAESLNVAMAASVVAFEVARQQRVAGRPA